MVGGFLAASVDAVKDPVLILVVMEYGRWGDNSMLETMLMMQSLNPCCNGIWSVGTQSYPPYQNITGLNPCCNGIWSVGGLNK